MIGMSGTPSHGKIADVNSEDETAASTTPGVSGGRWTRRRAALRAAQALAVCVSLVSLSLTAYGWYEFRYLRSHQQTVHVSGLGPDTPAATPTNTANSALPTSTAPSGAPSSSATVPHIDGAAQNILIVGIDSRAGLTPAERKFLKVGLHDTTTSTDTIMLVHVPSDGSRATLLSIPRDTYVQIPGFRSNKINAAYADGYYYSGAKTTAAQQAAGASELVATVKALTGVEIDHYVQVGFAGFEDIVHAIGNIPVDLCSNVNDTHARNVAEGGNGGSGFAMSAGHHELTPRQALEFVRQRHNIPGPITDDLGRELRQRYFIAAAFKRILSAGVLLNPSRLGHLIDAVDRSFTFDDKFDLTRFAEQMSNLTTGNIHGASIPVGKTAMIDGQDVLTVNPQKVRDFVHREFYPSPSPSPSKPASSSAAPRTSSAPAKPASAASSSASIQMHAPNRSCVY
jgi:LCP family protein required for cell wall assembly